MPWPLLSSGVHCGGRCGDRCREWAGLVFAQSTDNDKIWREFIDSTKAQPGAGLDAGAYRADLIKKGLTTTQADERLALLGKIYQSDDRYRAEASEVGFNRLYRAPIKDVKPGKALDIAMGQGRNAVYGASKGWDVTGFDVAEEGLKAAAANAAKAGTQITTVSSTFEGFDYGEERWDLIYFVYTDAPMVDRRPEVRRACLHGAQTG